jgi:hypothetical protein
MKSSLLRIFILSTHASCPAGTGITGCPTDPDVPKARNLWRVPGNEHLFMIGNRKDFSSSSSMTTQVFSLSTPVTFTFYHLPAGWPDHTHYLYVYAWPQGDVPFRKPLNLSLIFLTFQQSHGVYSCQYPRLDIRSASDHGHNTFLKDMNTQVFRSSIGAVYSLEKGRSIGLVSGGSTIFFLFFTHDDPTSRASSSLS